MTLFRIGRIVIPTPASEVQDELATVAHCVRQHTEREYVFLAAIAGYVPDELLFQWRALLHESGFVAAWMRDLDADDVRESAAA